MSEPKRQNFLHGAAILTVTVALVKIIGAIYKIPLGNILGDEGYAHFQVAYNIYALLLTLSTAGLPVALSKMISSALALEKPNQVRRIFSVARATFLTFGAVGTAIMLFFPGWLANSMSDPEAVYSIRALAPSLLFCCLLSAYRGYIQGHSNMKPTSITQIIEVVVKLVVGLSLAAIMLKLGKGLPMAAAGAIVGVSVSSLLAFIYIFFYKRRMDRDVDLRYADDRPQPRRRILGTLLAIAIPITIGSSALNIINIIDAKLVLSRLQNAAGFSYVSATTLYGCYSKVQTLFNLPSAFIVPLTLSMIPAVSAFLAQKKRAEAVNVAESSMRMTTLIAMPAALGLSVLSDPIMHVVFPTASAEGPALLAVCGIASYFVCLMLMSNAVLQAYGYEKLPVLTLPIGGVVKIVINYFLVGDPKLNIMGAPIGTLACYVVIAVLNIILLKRRVPERFNFARVFVKPLISSLIMAGAAYLSYTFLYKLAVNAMGSGRLVMLIVMALAIIVGIVVYMVLIIAMKALTKADLLLIPKGAKIAKFLRMK